MPKKRTYHIIMQSSNNIKKTLGLNLKKLRNAKSITQEHLAELLNMQAQSVTFIETGRTFVSSETLANFCNFFEVEPSFFFKSRPIEPSQKELDLKKDIYRLLSNCNYTKLLSIYNIIVALDNNS